MSTTPGGNSWVTCPRPRPQARLHLFCLPYAGGGASIYRAWPDDLPPEVEVCPIQLPGRESRFQEPAFARLALLVPALAHALRPYVRLPYALFGHSMGALLSFELARQFHRQGEPGPAHLFVSAFRAPQFPDPEPPLHDLPENAFIAELRRLSGTPEEVMRNTELMHLMVPMLRADFAIHETYGYTEEDPLACPISAFGGQQDNEVSYEELMGWREQTAIAFTLRMLPGTHFFIHSSRALLLRAVSDDLAQLLSQGPGHRHA